MGEEPALRGADHARLTTPAPPVAARDCGAPGGTGVSVHDAMPETMVEPSSPPMRYTEAPSLVSPNSSRACGSWTEEVWIVLGGVNTWMEVATPVGASPP